MYHMTIEFKSLSSGKLVQRSIEAQYPDEIIQWFNNHWNSITKRRLTKDIYFKIVKCDSELMKHIKVPKIMRKIIF
jgi:hypothetical protein